MHYVRTFFQDSKVQCTVYKQIEHVFALQKLFEMQAASLQTQVFFLLVRSFFSSFVSMTNIANDRGKKRHKKDIPSCKHMLPPLMSGREVGKQT